MKKTKYLFLSVKPEFANKLIAKEKNIELRKVRPRVNEGDYIIIYASAPIMGIIGFGRIKQIIESSPSEMWESHSSKLGIDKIRYDNYFLNRNIAIGIEIDSIRTVRPAITLSMIREVDDTFNPPQSYRYVSNSQIIELLQTTKR